MKKPEQRIEVNVAQVFVDKNGKFGNPVGIVVDVEQRIDAEGRQKLATKLNFSETVFIDSLDVTPCLSIFNPQHKVKFAGHAVLGTTYFIKHVLKRNIDSIKCSGELVKINVDSNVMYVNAPLSIMPVWNFEQLNSAKEIEQLSKEKIAQLKHTFIWAWTDESKSLVRARTFAPDWGIPEDQANGSGSMKLAHQLNRNLVITHGLGSIIYAKPLESEFAEVGGLVKILKR